MTDTIYKTGEYWENQADFHEKDSAFKASCCLEGLRHAGINLNTIHTVLDVGCGSGKFLSHLAEALPEASLTGVDLSEIPLSRARALYGGTRVSFEQAAVPDVSATYDLVTINDVFEHVDDYIGFLRQCRGLGSYFYFNIPLDMTVLSVIRHKYMHARKTVGHLHYFSGRSAVSTLEYAGYEPMSVLYNSSALHALSAHPTWKQYLLALPRVLMQRVSPEASAQFLGGSSLGVVCRARAS